MQWNHDINGHGTHVAGIILDVVDSGKSSSSGNNVDLFVVSAFDNDNIGYESDVVRAIRTCVEKGNADVVNLSLGNAYAPSQFTSELYASIVENYGAMLIAAAGNEDSEARDNINYYPAYHPSVVSVGAIMKDGMLLPNSVRNEQVEMVAPGAEILSTSVNYGDGDVQYGYERRSGTSAAAPHVTGAVALLKSHFPNCSNRQLRYAMAKSAVRNVIQDDNGKRDGLLMLSTLRDEQDVVDNSTVRDWTECDSTKGYGNIQVRDTLDWLLVQGGCDAWDTAYDSRGGCTTLEGGIVRTIQNQEPQQQQQTGESTDESDSDDEEDESKDDGSDGDDDGSSDSEETDTKDAFLSFKEALKSISGVTIKPSNEEQSEEENEQEQQQQTEGKVVEDGLSENEEDLADIEDIEVDQEVPTTSPTGLDETTNNNSTNAPIDTPIEDSTQTDEPIIMPEPSVAPIEDSATTDEPIIMPEPSAAPIEDSTPTDDPIIMSEPSVAPIEDSTTTDEPIIMSEPSAAPIEDSTITDEPIIMSEPSAAPINVVDDVTTGESSSGIDSEDTIESPTDSPTPPVKETSGTDDGDKNVKYAGLNPFFFDDGN